jgi:hypothetical protein
MITASAADVELVPHGGGGPQVQTSLGRKDVLLLGIVVGIGLVILAGGLAFALHLLLRKG